MSCTPDTARFENSRWSGVDQSIEFRHEAALALAEKGSVLDLGCGDGLLLSLLKERGVEVSGLDISEEAVRKCAAKGLTASVHSFSEPLPYPDGAFDTVVMLDVLEHVYDPLALLMEAERVARGSVIVGVPNFSSLPARLQVLRGDVPENNRPNKGHLYWFNYRVLIALVHRAKLKVAAYKANTFFPFSLASDFLTRLFPNLFSLSFVVKLEKKV